MPETLLSYGKVEFRPNFFPTQARFIPFRFRFGFRLKLLPLSFRFKIDALYINSSKDMGWVLYNGTEVTSKPWTGIFGLPPSIFSWFSNSISRLPQFFNGLQPSLFNSISRLPSAYCFCYFQELMIKNSRQNEDLGLDMIKNSLDMIKNRSR